MLYAIRLGSNVYYQGATIHTGIPVWGPQGDKTLTFEGPDKAEAVQRLIGDVFGMKPEVVSFRKDPPPLGGSAPSRP